AGTGKPTRVRVGTIGDPTFSHASRPALVQKSGHLAGDLAARTPACSRSDDNARWSGVIDRAAPAARPLRGWVVDDDEPPAGPRTVLALPALSRVRRVLSRLSSSPLPPARSEE